MLSRTILSIFLCLSLALPSFSQYELREAFKSFRGKRLSKMYYSNSMGEKGETSFSYYNGNQLRESRWILADGSRSSINRYNYDVNGNITHKNRVFSDSLTSNEVFTYLKNGLLKSEKFSRSDGFNSGVEYSYNESGNLTTAEFNNFHGWLNGRLVYNYKDTGEPHRADIIRENETIGYVQYLYNEDGMLAEEYWELYGSYSQLFRYEYEEYNMVCTSSNVCIRPSAKYRLSGEYYEYNKVSGGPSYYYYSDDGSLVLKTFYYKGKFRTKTTYKYDNEGILKSSTRTFNDSTSMNISYRYNEHRQLTLREYYRDGIRTGGESYEYNNGLLVRGRYENFDSWLTGDLVFVNDENGRVISGSFNSEKGNDAKIFFKYDDKGNLGTIDWNFNDGSSQRYEFEYSEIVSSQ